MNTMAYWPNQTRSVAQKRALMAARARLAMQMRHSGQGGHQQAQVQQQRQANQSQQQRAPHQQAKPVHQQQQQQTAQKETILMQQKQAQQQAQRQFLETQKQRLAAMKQQQQQSSQARRGSPVPVYDPEKPETWGRIFWETMHVVAAGYPEEPSESDKRRYKAYYETFVNVLPCTTCRDHFVSIMEATPINDNTLSSRAALARWVITVRNQVNDAIGKTRMYTYDEIAKLVNMASSANQQPALAMSSAPKAAPVPAPAVDTPKAAPVHHFRIVPPEAAAAPLPQLQKQRFMQNRHASAAPVPVFRQTLFGRPVAPKAAAPAAVPRGPATTQKRSPGCGCNRNKQKSN